MNDASTPGTAKPARHYPAARPKVPPFARYKGTSAWRKDRRRAKAYAMFLAATKQAGQAHGTTNA